MATPVLMPRQGNTVESCIILSWKKEQGDSVSKGEIVCEVETDKAAFEVESPETGVLLARFFEEGDDVPVLTNIAVIGADGESVAEFQPEQASPPAPAAPPTAPPGPDPSPVPSPSVAASAAPQPTAGDGPIGVSPRARRLAAERGIDPLTLGGSGPGGRIIERDVIAALEGRQPLTPAARALAPGSVLPARGTGIGGRIRASDVASVAAVRTAPEVTEITVRGMKKLVGDRMLASLQTTAQLTLNTTADARTLLGLRKRFKSTADSYGLEGVTINDLLLFVTARVLRQHPALNALMEGETIRQYSGVDLGVAVDTPRGLMVPIVRRADVLSLDELATETARLAGACMAGNISPDELNGGTFTLTNLGSLGVDSFTPVLNAPQVAILGVGGIRLQPVRSGSGEIEYVDSISLSLTIDHRAVDGAPGARFLKAIADAIADVDLLLISSADGSSAIRQ